MGFGLLYPVPWRLSRGYDTSRDRRQGTGYSRPRSGSNIVYIQTDCPAHTRYQDDRYIHLDTRNPRPQVKWSNEPLRSQSQEFQNYRGQQQSRNNSRGNNRPQNQNARPGSNAPRGRSNHDPRRAQSLTPEIRGNPNGASNSRNHSRANSRNYPNA